MFIFICFISGYATIRQMFAIDHAMLSGFVLRVKQLNGESYTLYCNLNSFSATSKRGFFVAPRERTWNEAVKAMLHEAIFLAICNATNVALQVARKNSRVTLHFATAIVALRVERPSTFRNVARQVACV